MTNAAKRHHYIPKFVLKEFTFDEQSLWLYDIQEGTTRQIGINDAVERDLYTVDKEGIKPDAVEKELARVEGAIAHIYRDILKTKQLPTGVDFERFLYFITLFSSRIPAFQKRVGNYIGQLCDGFKVALEHADPSTIFAEPLPPTVSVTVSVNVTPVNAKEVALRNMIDLPGELLPIFEQAEWALLVAGNSSQIVCSDNPLNVEYLNSESIMDGIKTASFPLSKDMALISGFSATSPPSVEEINARTVANVERFIFSSRGKFNFCRVL